MKKSQKWPSSSIVPYEGTEEDYDSATFWICPWCQGWKDRKLSCFDALSVRDLLVQRERAGMKFQHDRVANRTLTNVQPEIGGNLFI